MTKQFDDHPSAFQDIPDAAAHRSDAVPASASVDPLKQDPSASDDAQALALLVSKLIYANAEFVTDNRKGVLLFIETIQGLLECYPEITSLSLTVPLTTLSGQLNDLNMGRVGSIVRPVAGFDNRKPDSATRKSVKAFSSILVDILQRSGFSIMEASRIVASGLQRAGVPIHGRLGTEPWKTVKGWRERISKLPKNDQQREIYEQFKRTFLDARLKPGADAKAYVASQLDELVKKFGDAALE